MQGSLITPQEFILVSATAIGAYGGFPSPPKKLVNAVKNNKPLQYGLLFTLIWQGGGNQSVQKAIVGTAAFASIKYSMDGEL